MFGGIKTIQTTRINETVRSSAIRDDPDNWRTRRTEFQGLDRFNDLNIFKNDIFNTM